MLEFFYNSPKVDMIKYGDMSRRFTLRLPKGVSEFIVSDLESSLNNFFPKMFFDIEVKKRSLRFTIPENKNKYQFNN